MYLLRDAGGVSGGGSGVGGEGVDGEGMGGSVQHKDVRGAAAQRERGDQRPRVGHAPAAVSHVGHLQERRREKREGGSVRREKRERVSESE